MTWKKLFDTKIAHAYAAIASTTVIPVATSGTPAVTLVTAFGAMPSNDHANSVRGGCSVVSAMITGQNSTNVEHRKTAKTMPLTCADVRTKYAPDVPSLSGSPPAKAAVTKSLPKLWKKIATSTITLTRIEMLARPMRLAVLSVLPWRSSPAKNVDQYA